MTGRVTDIRRHPIKGIGSEVLERSALDPVAAMPGDRAWAIMWGDTEDTGEWQARRNFAQCASAPELMAITAKTDGTEITLNHPKAGSVRFDPTTEGDRLVAWLAPLIPAERGAATRLIRAPGHGMTDVPDPWISIQNLSSIAALSDKVGLALDIRRFRGNIILDGLGPWEEFEWVGKRFTLGTATLEGVEPIERCRATEANPETGQRDANTLRALEDGWGHRNMGLYARVIEAGEVSLGDTVQLV